MGVAATVIWLGTPERELPLDSLTLLDEARDPSPAPAVREIRIASIAPAQPRPELEPIEEQPATAEPRTPSEPEPRARREEPTPPTEQATLQQESELPEAPPPLEEPAAPDEGVAEARLEPTAELEQAAAEPESAPELELAADPPAEELAPANPEPSRLGLQEVQRPPVSKPDAPAQQAVAAAARPARAEPRPSRTEPVDAVSIAVGRHRIEQGRYPHQRASYARIGFEQYRDAMLALGGSFYLFDTRAKRVVAELDPFDFATRPTDRAPAHQSRWPRDVTRYLGDALDRDEIVRRYGRQSLRVVLLPPADLDAAFVGGLDRALRREGIAIERVTQVRLIYELTPDGLACEVARLDLRDGTQRTLSLRLALSGPIPSTSSRDGSSSPAARPPASRSTERKSTDLDSNPKRRATPRRPRVGDRS